MSFLLITVFMFELLLIGFALYFIFSFINRTPFYPSSLKQLDDLKNSGLIDFSNHKHFVDIGSGDGRITRWFAKQGLESVTGIEYNPYLTLYSRFRSFAKKNVKIVNGNFNKHDYTNYDLVYMYIFSEHIDSLKNKLLNELKSGSLIVTNTFKFSDIEPDLVHKKFYIYKIK